MKNFDLIKKEEERIHALLSLASLNRNSRKVTEKHGCSPTVHLLNIRLDDCINKLIAEHKDNLEKLREV